MEQVGDFPAGQPEGPLPARFPLGREAPGEATVKLARRPALERRLVRQACPIPPAPSGGDSDSSGFSGTNWIGD